VTKFHLMADVRSANRSAIRPVLRDLHTGSDVTETEHGFSIDAEVEGANAQDLNRTLLSALRRVERRTAVRAEWTSEHGTGRYFDYVRKSQRSA
jgi:hypothetical protein